MAKLEREYNVPLRREWLKAPKYKRAKKAVTALREFLVKHMKSEDVKIGVHANRHIWSKGMRNPPHHIKVTAVKDDNGAVIAELIGVKVAEPKAEKNAAKKIKEEKAPAKKTKKEETHDHADHEGHAHHEHKAAKEHKHEEHEKHEHAEHKEHAKEHKPAKEHKKA